MEQFYWVQGREEKMLAAMVHYPAFENDLKKAPVIVYMHGFTGDKTGGNRMGVKLARYLCKEGYIVIRFDYAGSGESEGEFAEDTSFSGWVKDAKTILEWAAGLEKADSERIGLLGHSLGGALVTYLSSLDLGVKTTCALAPVSDLVENFKQIIIGPTLWEKALKGDYINDFYGKKFSLSPNFIEDLTNYRIQEAAQHIHQPFLIIHGEQDTAVPVHYSHVLEAALASSEKDLQVFAEEDHSFSEKIYSAIAKWFKQFL